MPQTPEGVAEDVLEESEEEPEMAPEPVPNVVLEEVLVEGAMIAACAGAPSPPHGASAVSSSTPRAAAGATAGTALGPEVILGHPTLYKRRCLQLWATMLKETTVSERAAAWARQRGFDL
jgi:hypothetical protein